MMKRVCIVGLGWLGKELAVALKKLDHHVIGTTTSATKVDTLERIIDKVKVFNLNDSDLDFLNGFDLLIYTIPPSSREKYSELSRLFLEKVLEINPHVIIVYTSSTSVYGNEERDVDEQSLINPSSASAKKIAELEQYIQQSFKEWAIFRLGGLVGDERHPVKYLSGRSIVPKPLAPLNLLHRKDAVRAVLHVLSNFKSGIYNLCSENHPTKSAYYNTIANQYKMKAIEFDNNDFSKDKVVNCIAIIESGFEFNYTSPYDFPFDL